ncbi:MAG: hypothetical protein JO210_01155 [Acidobacteriaceae bacterium]|nr:hypothetical protein [Acidobacteriaceae bacterium]
MAQDALQRLRFLESVDNLEPRVKAHVMVALLGYALWVTLVRNCWKLCASIHATSPAERAH